MCRRVCAFESKQGRVHVCDGEEEMNEGGNRKRDAVLACMTVYGSLSCMALPKTYSTCSLIKTKLQKTFLCPGFEISVS